MDDEHTPRSSLLNREIPLSKPVVYGVIGALGVFVVFIYGVIVGLYQAPPWDTIKFLVVPDEDTMEELRAEQVARQAPAAAQQAEAEQSLPGVLRSTLLNFDIVWVNPDQPITGLGGGLSGSDDRIIIARQIDGEVLLFDAPRGVLFRTGVNMPESNFEAGGLPDSPGRVRTFPPRYTNAAVGSGDDGEYMIAVYGYNDVEEECRTLRVAKTDLPANWDQIVEAPFDLEWTLLFESEPCLSYAATDPPITGYQEGGLLIRDASGDWLFSTGDMGQEGSPTRPRVITQDDPETDYGRIFRISATSFEVTPVAMGARNPQGATTDDEGRVWFVDQGPMGGDEVNLLEQGANYGWPWATYGAHYTAIEQDSRMWFHADVLGHHDGYVQPRYVFLPSVALSDITHVHGVHPNWDGDLLATTLLEGALVRLIREEDRILGQEVLAFNNRMRSVVVADGRIYFMTDDGVLGYLTPRSTAATSGPATESLAVLQRAGCIECHSKTSIPSLTGVFGQQIASQRGVAYSDALAATPGRWTGENLSAFIADPAAFAPGTSMPATPLSRAEVAEVVEALQTLSDDQP